MAEVAYWCALSRKINGISSTLKSGRNRVTRLDEQLTISTLPPRRSSAVSMALPSCPLKNSFTSMRPLLSVWTLSSKNSSVRELGWPGGSTVASFRTDTSPVPPGAPQPVSGPAARHSTDRMDESLGIVTAFAPTSPSSRRRQPWCGPTCSPKRRMPERPRGRRSLPVYPSGPPGCGRELPCSAPVRPAAPVCCPW